MAQRQIRELFDAALDQPPESRAQFLHEMCKGDQQLETAVAKLLAARERSGGVLDTPVKPRLTTTSQAPEIGSQIGPYKILRELGAGGMGVVYQVVRADGVFDRVSALKVIRTEFAGANLIDSFRRERKILALLDDLHVARIVDGGSTPEGLPYFVADFVDGLPIDRYCSHHQLTIRQRMAIFQQVCEAADYLHRHNVVHCDLKPPNILVTGDGIVKLVDFGIARLWVQDTTGPGSSLRLMTPAYASPEQCRREKLTPASDIYSLGVVLFELLTGTRPSGISASDSRSTLVVAPVDAPSDVVERSDHRSAQAKELRGDLDAIVLRATRPEPSDRYRSAAEFGSDVGNYLSGRAVNARGGAVYRAGVALRRNLRSLLVAMFLLALIGVNIWQGIETARSKQDSDRKIQDLNRQLQGARVRLSEAQRTQSLGQAVRLQKQDLVNLDNAYRTEFSDAIREWPGKTPERQKLIGGAQEYLKQAEPLLPGNSDERAGLAAAWITLGDLQSNPNFGDRAGARGSLDQATRIVSGLGNNVAQSLKDRLRNLGNQLIEK